jgi:hypothetical protein
VLRAGAVDVVECVLQAVEIRSEVSLAFRELTHPQSLEQTSSTDGEQVGAGIAGKLIQTG